ncbi:YheC/YheD family protein [Paenibacillus sp. NPDC057967]|uniref:YheC/YheD family protein n=1 Tax=Paenibacillus sp. NPDC057967 TaxID=3346293 RepID=UPI0036DE5F6A
MAKLKVKASGKPYRVSDKWAKTNIMLRDEGLRGYIPSTRKFSRLTLHNLLQAHQMVYVKPTYGSLGKGVMRVERLGSGEYWYQLGGSHKTFHSFDGLYHSLKRDTLGKSYLVQRGVHLLKYEGRRFDLRVVVQRAPQGGWEMTGIVARIAHPEKIVTNGSQGGSILTAEQVLSAHMSPSQLDSLKKRLEDIGISTVKRLHRRYPRLNEIGLDIAIDNGFRPWILEVNTTPDHCPFAILPDQSMIRRIIHYGSQYGRHYRLNCFKAKNTL